MLHVVVYEVQYATLTDQDVIGFFMRFVILMPEESGLHLLLILSTILVFGVYGLGP